MKRRPKVLLSAGMIQEGLSGVGRYVVELAPRLFESAEIELHVVGFDEDRSLFPTVPDGHWWSIPAGAQGGIKNLLWHQYSLPRLLRQEDFDLLHIPSYRRIVACSPIPQLATVHDCAPFRLRDKYGLLRGIFGRKIAPALARRCTQILTVSEFTKADIVQFYGIDASRVEVIYNGLDHHRYRPADAEALKAFRRRLHLEHPFFLYVSRLEHPGKNHLTLIEAFERFCQHSTEPIHLVLAGAPWQGAEVIKARARSSSVASRIHLPGFIDEADLPLWYAAAEALVFPSLMEGFGLPVAEAMACGTMVLSSDRGSLPEVGGTAAIYFDPAVSESILGAMQQWNEASPEQRQQRIQQGLAYVSQFDWDKAANSTCNRYITTLNGN